MNDLDERKSDLLDLIIRDYIKTARPVASARLVEEYGLGMSSATARNEMLALDELGYLEQPHHSAGRVPTASAYRFFVDRIGERFRNAPTPERLTGELKAAEDIFEAAVRIVASRTKNLGLAGWFSKPESFRFSGLAEMLRQPEFVEGSLGADFVATLEILMRRQEMLEELVEAIDAEEPRVFIGEENPLKMLRGWSMVVARVQDGDAGVMAVIGPTRMPYHENIPLAATLARLIEDIAS